MSGRNETKWNGATIWGALLFLMLWGVLGWVGLYTVIGWLS